MPWAGPRAESRIRSRADVGYETLLLLRLVGAFTLFTGVALLAPIMLPARSRSPAALLRLGAALAGGGAVTPRGLRDWLVADRRTTASFEGWIIASLILWAISTASPARAVVEPDHGFPL